MVIQTSSLLFSHHRVELFHFPLHVLIFPPCLILSRLSQKILYSTQMLQRASWPCFHRYYLVLHIFSSPSLCTPQMTSCQSLRHPQTISAPFLSIFPTIYLTSSSCPESLKELSTENWIGLPMSEWSLILSPSYVCRVPMCWVFSAPPNFKWSASQTCGSSCGLEIRSQHLSKSHLNALILSNYCIDIFFLCSLGKPLALEKDLFQPETVALFFVK